MNIESFSTSLMAVGGILLCSAAIAWRLAALLFPGGRGWSIERCGWSVGLAVFLIALNVCLGFTLGIRPGWVSFLSLLAAGWILAKRYGLPRSDRLPSPRPRLSPVSLILLALTAAGCLTYFVRSLAEPMWSNDFLAIWGLKGKTFFAEAAIPQSLFRWPEFEFSNPSYPVGLPLVYAGVAFLLGSWDDHAMALLFPLFQVGTLLVLVGWLRRRGVRASVALAASTLVAHFGLLYSAWLTGMAEVPASFTFLLVGTAFCDAVDDTDGGCRRRLFLASLLASATKNEGIFMVGVAFALLALQALGRRGRKLWAAAAAALVPGAASVGLHRLVLGKHPLPGLDFAYLWHPGFGSRVVDSLREEFNQLVKPALPALAAILVLSVLALRQVQARRILVLASVSLATYLALPAFCTFGPGWLVHWTVPRIAAALGPLVAVGLAVGWQSSPHPIR